MRRTATLFVATILSAGCSKPAPPKPPPTAEPPRIVSPWAPHADKKTGSAESVSEPKELDRNNPEYVAIREVFASAKKAYNEGNFRVTFAHVLPSSRPALLSRLARFAGDHAWSDEQKATLKDILGRHIVPESVEGEPSGWDAALDPEGAFAELMTWFVAQMWEVPFIDESFAGEPRVYEISHARVQVYICLPGEARSGRTTRREFVRMDGNWYMTIA